VLFGDHQHGCGSLAILFEHWMGNSGLGHFKGQAIFINPDAPCDRHQATKKAEGHVSQETLVIEIGFALPNWTAEPRRKRALSRLSVHAVGENGTKEGFVNQPGLEEMPIQAWRLAGVARADAGGHVLKTEKRQRKLSRTQFACGTAL